MSRGPMSEEMFAELLESVREGGAILRGEKKPSRVFVVEPSNEKHINKKQGQKKSQVYEQQNQLQ